MRRRLVATGVLLLLALTGCGGGKRSASATVPYEDPGMVHAHGLGVDPADGSLFIATHTGLFRAAKSQDTARRVGKSFQDTMGFTVTGPGRFLGSGHPDAQSHKPPLLGLIESIDAGKSWNPVALEGKADFHVLRTAGQLVVGYDATGNRLLRISSGAKPTRLRKPPGTIIDLVIDPGDARHYVAATERGLFESLDAGGRWSRLDRHRTGLLAYLESGLTLVRGDGVVERLTPQDRWLQLGQVHGRPGALASSGDTLYLAVQDGPVLDSSDGGKTWQQRVRAGA